MPEIPAPQLRDALTESVRAQWRTTAGRPSDGPGWLLAARLWPIETSLVLR